MQARPRWLFLEGYLYDNPRGNRPSPPRRTIAPARGAARSASRYRIRSALTGKPCADFLTLTRVRWITSSAITRNGWRLPDRRPRCRPLAQAATNLRHRGVHPTFGRAGEDHPRCRNASRFQSRGSLRWTRRVRATSSRRRGFSQVSPRAADPLGTGGPDGLSPPPPKSIPACRTAARRAPPADRGDGRGRTGLKQQPGHPGRGDEVFFPVSACQYDARKISRTRAKARVLMDVDILLKRHPGCRPHAQRSRAFLCATKLLLRVMVAGRVGLRRRPFYGLRSEPVIRNLSSPVSASSASTWPLSC